MLYRRAGVVTYRLLLLCACGVLLAACGDDGPAAGNENGDPDEKTIPFRKDGELTFLRGDAEDLTIDIEVADTDSARQRGLMQRSSLPEMSGMLFVFRREEIQSFWMANTPLALDLIFVDADSQIVDIDKYTTPFSSESIVSDEPAQYVIEVPAGFADTYGITAGEGVRWRLQSKGLAARTRSSSLGIHEVKSLSIQAIAEIEFGAGEVDEAPFVEHDAKTVDIDNAISLLLGCVPS